MADVRRPTRIDVPENIVTSEVSIEKDEQNDGETEVSDILISPILTFIDEQDISGQYILPISDEMFVEERFKKFNSHTYNIGKLIRLSELVSDTLAEVVSNYLRLNSIDEILARNSDCFKLKNNLTTKAFKKLTFGELRNILSCMIKTDGGIAELKMFNSRESRKEFTKTFSDYIEDRDIFTHGILFFQFPDYRPILRVKSQAGDIQYVTFNEGIFTDSLRVFRYLLTGLREIAKMFQDDAIRRRQEIEKSKNGVS